MGVLSLAGAVPRSLAAHGNTPRDFEAPAVFQAAGPTAASIFGTIEQFRFAIGGDDNRNNAGPLTTGRREINWDGGGSATSLGGTPLTNFLNTRGALFMTPGSGFVQAPPSGIATTFGNPAYETAFQPFSLQRLFSPIDARVTDTQFFIPGTSGGVAATTTGFGAVFSDVDQPDGSGPGRKRGNRHASTLIEYFDREGHLLFTSTVPAAPGTATFSFFGVLFKEPRIALVRITTGNRAPGPDDDGRIDIVLMDDFIYGEPRELQ